MRKQKSENWRIWETNHMALHHLSLLHSQVIKPNWACWAQIGPISVLDPNQIQTKKQNRMTEYYGTNGFVPPPLSFEGQKWDLFAARNSNCQTNKDDEEGGCCLLYADIRYYTTRERMPGQTKWLRMLRAIWEKIWVLLEYFFFFFASLHNHDYLLILGIKFLIQEPLSLCKHQNCTSKHPG